MFYEKICDIKSTVIKKLKILCMGLPRENLSSVFPARLWSNQSAQLQILANMLLFSRLDIITVKPV